MSLFLPPTASSMPEWVRKAATTVNKLLERQTFTPLGTAPANPRIGDGYFDTSDNKAKIWDGSVWQPLW
ncbi:hypothetical protein [Sphingobium olei]|uniref:Uncharacterized protein n=1 Tax=Sphingobium olei TaxID=420955 RepID=A0ABW3NZ65_9SPHN